MKPEKNRYSGVEILIAEDSPTQAEKLRSLLEEHGYTVVTAPDGKQALALARRRKPTLVISDVMMPEMGGFELCREIKGDEQLKDVPVILLTSLSDVRDIMQGLECGADNFIRKPYEDRYLLARIDYLLMNLELRKSQKMRMGVEIYEFAGIAVMADTPPAGGLPRRQRVDRRRPVRPHTPGRGSGASLLPRRGGVRA